MSNHDKQEMTPAQRAALDRVLARARTPEVRAEHQQVREQVMREHPPLRPDPALVAALAGLRAERERQGLSLAEVAERTGIDKATLSRLETGKVANPTVETLRNYASALGKRLAWSVEDLQPLSS